MKGVDKDLLEILQGLTEFNPYFRCSARELLKHKYFDDVRIPKIEKSASAKIKLKIDEDESFDYENGVALMYSKKDIVKFIIEEVEAIHAKRVQ